MELERETGIEPATSSLGSWHSTTELLPLVMVVTSEIVTLRSESGRCILRLQSESDIFQNQSLSGSGPRL
jgi:hypothetical protein